MSTDLMLPGYLSGEDVKAWAQVFVASGMFKDTKGLAQAMVKIQAGQELGLPPFAAMRGFDVIDGKPAPNAGLVGAMVKRSARYDYRIVASDATECAISFLEGGEDIGLATYTIEEAKAAGLAGKANWKKYAADMLFARCLSRGARRFCPDLFLGSVYVPEELGDDGAAERFEIVVESADVALEIGEPDIVEIEEELDKTAAESLAAGEVPGPHAYLPDDRLDAAPEQIRETVTTAQERATAGSDMVVSSGMAIAVARNLNTIGISSDDQRHALLDTIFQVKSSKALLVGEAEVLIDMAQQSKDAICAVCAWASDVAAADPLVERAS